MANIAATTLTGLNKLSMVTPSADGDSIPCDGQTGFVVVVSTAATGITVTSQTDPQDRTKDINYSLPVGVHFFGPFYKTQGWATPNGKMQVTFATPANIKLGAFRRQEF